MFFRLAAPRLAIGFPRLSAIAEIGGQFGMFAEGPIGSNGAPENDARLRQGRGDDVWIVAFPWLAIRCARCKTPSDSTSRR
jgi:hypothetical protein